MTMESYPTHFTVGADEFRHGTLNAKDEFHCVRRLAPLVKSSAILASTMAANADDDADWLASLIEGAGPLLQALSALSDADADYVFAKCMGVTEAREGEAWVPVWDRSAQTITLSRLNTNHILRITYQVMREAISVFFSQTQSSLIELGVYRPIMPR